MLLHVQQQASFSRARVVVVRAAAQKMSELPSSLQKIVGAFQMVPDPMARYKQLLFYATKLEKLPDELHTPANKVEGCVSQVMPISVVHHVDE
jgi:sulfur transfer protein SufE